MPGDEPPVRKRGRPSKAPEELSQRPTIAVRVRPELHATITAAAKKNGRSMAQEMERCLEEAFSTTPNEATLKAVEAARREADDAMLADFHGQSGYLWGRLSADLYLKALTEAALEVGPEVANQVSPEFVSALAAKVVVGQGEIVETWKNAARFSRAAAKLNKPGALDDVFAVIKSNDDLKQRLEAIFGRPFNRAEKSGQ